jgi:hypothetical protein
MISGDDARAVPSVGIFLSGPSTTGGRAPDLDSPVGGFEGQGSNREDARSSMRVVDFVKCNLNYGKLALVGRYAGRPYSGQFGH